MKLSFVKTIIMAAIFVLAVIILPIFGLAVSPENNYEIYHYETGDASENGYAESYLVNSNGERVSLEEIALENAPVFYSVMATSSAEDYSLPESYDARDYGYITSVKQQQGGTCWAQAATACLEASYLKQGLTEISEPDFSEMHLAWSFYFQNTDNTDDPTHGDGTNQTTMPISMGGNEQSAFSALARWSGAASETDYPAKATVYQTRQYYINNMTYADRYAAVVHLENYVELPNSVQEIKQAILDNGAVCVSYMSSGSGLPYYYTDGEIDHSILVVGWDDTISAEKFSENNSPARDGAWLCKNSWGTSHGDGGYFWMSYDQTQISRFFYYSADDNFYDNNYQYCGSTPSFYSVNTTKEVASANIFTASSDETLEAVSAYLPLRDTDYTIEIYTGLPEDYTNPTDRGTLSATVSGSNKHSGYYTIELDHPVSLSEGEIFSVVLKTNSSWASTQFIAIGNSYYEHYESKRGYIMTSSSWRDASSAVSNDIYLRAFTNTKPATGGFTVTFNSCNGEALTTCVSDDSGSVNLPVAPENYEYKFSRNGADFDGRNITDNITVDVHCYSPDKTVADTNDPCKLNCICENCGDTIYDIPSHTFEKTVIYDWGCKRTESLCSLCGYYKTEFDFPPSTKSGIINDHAAWYLDNDTGDFYIVGRGEIENSAASTITPVYGWANYSSSIIHCHIGNEITSIPNNFLYMCPYLEDVEILGNLTRIPENAFSYCPKLASVNIPSSVKRICKSAFFSTGLVSVHIPESIEIIETLAFGNCESLSVLKGLEGIRKIGDYAFLSNSLKGRISLPESLCYFGYGAFADSRYLEAIDINPSCPCYNSFSDGYILSEDGTELLYYSRCLTDEVFRVPECVEVIGDYAFYRHTYLKYIGMPSVTTVSAYAFEESSVKGVGFESNENITIGRCSFRGASDMTAIYLPSTVTSIGNYAVGYTKENKVNKSFTVYCESGSAAETYASGKSIAYSLEHSEHEIKRTDIVTATCQNDGIRYGLCSVCSHVDNACEPYSVNGEHTFEWINDIDPTCLSSGIMHGVCVHCGSIGEENSIAPATGHSYDWVTDLAETCESDGIKHEECLNCGKKQSENTVIPATGHSYEWIIDVAAKCGSEGLKHEECTSCGKEKSLNTVIPATNQHPLYTNIYVCTDTKTLNRRICVDCNYIREEIVLYNSPHYSTVLVVDKEATCVSTGTGHRECVNCKAVTSSNITLNKTSHPYEWVTDQDADCINPGTKHRKCSYCSYVDSTQYTISALEHSYEWIVDTEPSCETPGTKHQECVACGETASDNTEISAVGHKYEWVIVREPTCSEVGIRHKCCTLCQAITVENTEIETKAHSYEWITDIEPGCGTEGTKHQECSVCKDIISENTAIAATGEHTYEWVTDREPTCIKEGIKHQYCSVCNTVAMRNTLIPTVEHEIGDWEYSQNGIFVKKCKCCNFVSEEKTVEIFLSASSLDIENSVTCTVQATVTGLEDLNVTYSSSDSEIITVDKNGTVSAVGIGTAQINAVIEGTDISAVCEVTVQPREFTVTWIVDGEITQQKVKEESEIIKPDNPQKDGLFFAGWSPSVPKTMPPYDITFTAVFKNYDVSKIKLSISAPSSIILNYGESLKLYADVSNLPDDAKIKWYVEGKGVEIVEISEAGRICTVRSKATGDAVVRAYVATSGGKAILDLDGNRITDSQPLQSQANLWLRIVHFFKMIFRQTISLNIGL